VAAKGHPHQLITLADVTKVLNADVGPEAVLNQYEIKDFTSKGDNFTSSVTSVSVKYSLSGEEKTTSYVVKLNPCKSENFNIMVNTLFWKEIKFYSELLPKINAELSRIEEEPLKVPKCLYFSETFREEVMYFEDLRCKQFKMYDRRKSLDFVHAEMIIAELSRLHAASVLLLNAGTLLGKDPTRKFPYLVNTNEEIGRRGGTPVYNDFIAGFLETAASVAERCNGYERVAKALRSLKENCKERFTEDLKSNNQFKVFAHTDCWTNNFLFRLDEIKKYKLL